MGKVTMCKGCRAQLHILVPIRGPLSLPFRLMGIKPSRMNPNLCNICETRFRKIWRTRQIIRTATILFADIRGYTTLCQALDSRGVPDFLSHFYDRCADAIWERDGMVNKLIGDALLAVFNFPILRQDHVEIAVDAGLELQRRCWELKAGLGKFVEQLDCGVGVGIHSGKVSIGEIGEYCRDFTAIGEVVNLTSRLQGVARAGQVVLSEAVYEKVREVYPGASAQTFAIKGVAEPVRAYVLEAR